MQNIAGLEIHEHEKSKRIINISLDDEIIKKLIFPFNKFDLTALELKPFTRFTIAKSLDDLTNNKLSELMNKILRDRDTGLSLIHISEPTRLRRISYAVFCLKKKKK